MPLDLTPISGSSTTLLSYLIVADADALAAQLPGNELKAFRAASVEDRDAALKAATADIDGQKWQGRKYDRNQALEFPRVSDSLAGPNFGEFPPSYQSVAANIWDVDANGVAVVPQRVQLACLYQADSRLAGRSKRLDAQHDGLASQGIGSLSEAYTGTAAGSAAPKLCNEAMELLKKYRIRTAKII